MQEFDKKKLYVELFQKRENKILNSHELTYQTIVHRSSTKLCKSNYVTFVFLVQNTHNLVKKKAANKR